MSGRGSGWYAQLTEGGGATWVAWNGAWVRRGWQLLPADAERVAQKALDRLGLALRASCGGAVERAEARLQAALRMMPDETSVLVPVATLEATTADLGKHKQRISDLTLQLRAAEEALDRLRDLAAHAAICAKLKGTP